MGHLSFQDFFKYDAWATASLFEGVSALTEAQFIQEFGGELTSVQQQGVHLVSVSDRYRARFMNEPVPDVRPESFRTPAELLAYSLEVAERLRMMVDSLPEERLLEVIRHETRRGLFIATAEETLFHVINHATYHRGQIACLLKLHGIEPVDTDLLIWFKYRVN